jgi:N-acetylmuramoyl-L-alanine amidase
MTNSQNRTILRGLRAAQDDMPVMIAIALLTIAATLLVSGSPDEMRISVYSSVANYSLPVLERNNLDYVGLLELVEPLGPVSATISGDRWKLHYADAESEFIAGKTHARIRGSEVQLASTFLLEHGRGLVSLSSLSSLLPRILAGPITFNQGARRLFVGNVAVHFTAQIDSTPPAKLVMNFTSPVNPMIATEPGKLRMLFTHDPIVAPGSPTLTFDSNVISSARFEESNGAAEIVISSTSPVMANFSNDGRTITITSPTITSPPVTAVQTQAPAQPQPANPAQPTIIASTSAPEIVPRHIFAVIDASHGGDERGAALTDQLPEKDVTLAFARALRAEMMSRGLPALLLRDGDFTLSMDQRAATSNSSTAAIYLCVHATSQGDGLRLYTALMPIGGDNHVPFLDWNTAQSQFLTASQIAEAGIAASLKSKQLPVRTFSSPLRPLNNITMAALAIEVGPTTGNVSQLTSPAYQQLIAQAVADGVAGIRDKLPAGQR